MQHQHVENCCLTQRCAVRHRIVQRLPVASCTMQNRPTHCTTTQKSLRSSPGAATTKTTALKRQAAGKMASTTASWLQTTPSDGHNSIPTRGATPAKTQLLTGSWSSSTGLFQAGISEMPAQQPRRTRHYCRFDKQRLHKQKWTQAIRNDMCQHLCAAGNDPVQQSKPLQ